MKVIYRSEDGRDFDSPYMCEAYEHKRKVIIDHMKQQGWKPEEDLILLFLALPELEPKPAITLQEHPTWEHLSDTECLHVQAISDGPGPGPNCALARALSYLDGYKDAQ